MTGTQRLQRYLAYCGVASRRKAEEIISRGLVRVNGRVVCEPGTRVEPGDQVELAGRPVEPFNNRIYLALNKPAGYLSAVSDTRARPVVIDLLPGITGRVFPVGRLDYNTRGLLLITNDGDLANRLAHPRYQVPKTYRAIVKGSPSAEDLLVLRKGVVLEDGPALPADVRLLERYGDNSLLEITLREGRKREVRRMGAAIGHQVLDLQRTGYAFLTLDNLSEGQYRHLTPLEVQRLKAWQPK